MKILFWSLYHGQTGVSTNLAAVSTKVALETTYKSVILHDQYSHSMVESYFGLESENYGPNKGIDPIVNSINSKTHDKTSISSHAISLLSTSGHGELEILVGSNHDSRTAPEEMNKLFVMATDAADGAYDFVFIDAHSGEDDRILRLMDSVDVVVVCINQNKFVLEKTKAFYEAMMNRNERDQKRKETSAFKDRVVFMIGNYDPMSKMTVKNIRRKYGLPSVVTMPNNTGLQDAVNNNRLINYIYMNRNVNVMDDNHLFMKHLNETSMKVTGTDWTKEEKGKR